MTQKWAASERINDQVLALRAASVFRPNRLASLPAP